MKLFSFGGAHFTASQVIPLEIQCAVGNCVAAHAFIVTISVVSSKEKLNNSIHLPNVLAFFFSFGVCFQPGKRKW